MAGETDLERLLIDLAPALMPETYVFAQTDERSPPGAIMTFREAEGMTVVMTQEQAAAAGLKATFPSRLITLRVHSSLEAVGFLAAILPKLAAEKIAVNAVAGYCHDHLFVPQDRAEDAMRVLRELTRLA